MNVSRRMNATFKIKFVSVVVLTLVLSTGIFGDTWYNNYKRGKDAVEKKNWGKAVRYLRAALEDKNEPRLKAKTYGLRFEDYLPYYYLGTAYYGNGLYKEAQTALEHSADYGVVRKTGLYDTLKEMLANCKEKLKPAPLKSETLTETHDPREKEQKKVEETTEPENKKKPPPKEEKSKVAIQPPDLPQKQPENKQEIPPKEKEAVSEDTRLVEGIGNLNRGIRFYFEGNRSESERYLREALPAFSGESKDAKELITTYQFLAVILIENHYLTEDPSGRLLSEAEKYIKKIRTLAPGFRLDDAYFSPKVISIFSRGMKGVFVTKV